MPTPRPGWWRGNDEVIRVARPYRQPDILSNWIGWFGDQFDHSAAIPGRFEAEVLQVEERPLGWIEAGCADGALATVSHVAELATACAGDASTRSVHMWLWHSTSASRSTCLAT
jgi:hypothetical protein